MEIVWIIVLIILLVVSYLLMPSSKATKGPDPAKIDDFNIATATEDRVVTEVFGTRRLAPNLIWYGKLRSRAIKRSGGKKTGDVTIGYKYTLSMLYAIGAPVDHLLEFWRNVNLGWDGDLTANGDDFRVRTGKAGKPNGSGTGKSTLLFYNGTQTSIDSEYADKSGDLVPYKGTSLIWMDNVFIGDNVTSVDPYLVTVSRFPHLLGISANRHIINGTDANPAEVLYWILRKFIKLVSSLIDTTTFLAVAAELYDEGMGVSFTMSVAKSGDEWIKEILRHIDGVLFFDNSIGKFTLKLIREDYVVGDLEVVDENVYKRLRFSRQAWEDCYTDLTVGYVSPRTWEMVSFTLVNPANREIIGYAKTKSVQYPFFITKACASQAVANIQRRIFYPLALCKFEVSKLAFNPNPGDVFKLSSTRLGFSEMVMRVTGVIAGEGTDQKIEVECAEDLFSVGTSDVVEIPGSDGGNGIDWEIEDEAVGVVVVDALQELAQELAIVVLAAPPPNAETHGFNVFVNGDLTAVLDFSGYGELDGAYSASTNIMDETVGFAIENCVNISAVANSRGSWQRLVSTGILLQTDGTVEVIAIKTIAGSGTDFVVTGVLRELAGTRRVTHPTGTKFYLLPDSGSDFAGLVSVQGQSFSTDLTIEVQPFNIQTASEELTTVMHEYGFRPETPYPVAQLAAVRVVNDITITWTPRKRHGLCTENNPDNFTAHDDDYEGTWEVSASGITTQFVATPEFTATDPTPRTYSIRSYLNGRFSAATTILI